MKNIGLHRYVAHRFFEIRFIKFSAEGFLLAIHKKHPDAPRSPFYIDLRPLRSRPGLLCDVVTLMIEAQPKAWEELDLVSDIPLASSPIVTLISQRTGIPMITPWLAGKGYGTKDDVLGEWETGQRVGLFDDLRTTGGSKEQVIALYESKGLKVVRVDTIIDRGDPEGAPVLGRPFSSLYAWSWLLEFYRDRGLIPSEFYERSLAYPKELTEFLRAKQRAQ